ncbi:MAG: 5'-methylthioadenosine/adenosylhomocysteine nucleosidase [Bacteroidota bacterium]|nr:5'-methylthioadenosine/adenosylhomocysteine nucleosidase [Bacteroidota bacterium]MDP4234091.1 5'-methylthioadenosine/adenosylhomocysteine nucleosidase [Bacteroidota bacterium]MDP4243032.1 5'-methylthioadenosine/adenosylhomocysteine nucleosidase [Bacteroidota bacterium]MDP4287458.1 5'-methylthioadenosine/adenosylhomocysteine nucleosidase [Bacteroidota bacterium]
MKLGLIGAMPQEIEAIAHDFTTDHTERIAGRDFHVGTFAGVEAVLVFSRWGKVAAAMTATALIERFGVDLVIFTGVAGAVHPELSVGDVVIADTLIQHDFDASLSGMFSKFEIPLLGISRFPVEARLSKMAHAGAERFFAASESTSRAVIGTIASGDEFIAGLERLEEIRQAIPGVMCVEMEGAAVAQVCHEYKLPFLVIRTISDKADHSAAVDFMTFLTETAAIYSHGILKHLVTELSGSS